MRHIGWLDDLRHDLRYAARFLRRSPAFTAVAVLSLALGIGASTAVFSLVDRILLRELPVRRPAELHALGTTAPGGEPAAAARFTHGEFRALRERGGHLFAGMFAATDARRLVLTDRGQREEIPRGALLVSGEYWTTLGVRPLLGRGLGPEDDGAPGAHPVAVLGHRWWRTRFGADPAIVGRAIVVNDRPFVVVGVMPEHFTGTTVGQDPALYLPLAMDAVATRAPSRLDGPDDEFLQIMGRLRPGVDARRAGAELTPLYRRLAMELRGDARLPRERARFAATTIEVAPAAGGFGGVRQRYGTLLAVLSTMVAALLLLACANVGSLLVARSASRQREIAVRRSLGASRGRLVRQLLTESLLLALAGGALGLLLAAWSGPALAALLTGGQAMWLDLRPDGRVLAFTTLASVASAALFGLLPAAGGTRSSLAATLRGGATSGRGGMRVGVGKALVTAQVAVSVLLVATALLFTRSLGRLYAVDTGFESDGLLVVRLNPTRSGYEGERARLLYERLLARAGALPGVTAATLANSTPFDGVDQTMPLAIEGYVPDGSGEDVAVRSVWAGPAYFATMGQRLVAGRDFADRDGPASPRVAVVNEAFVRAYLPGRPALGARLGRGGTPAARRNIEIVGVVRDAKDADLRTVAPPVVYLPFFQNYRPARGTLVLRARDPGALAAAVRAEVRAVDPTLDLLDVMTMTAQLDDTVGRERVVARLSGLFASAALLLACVGLYGVLAYAVARRTAEIGIRMALGAEPGRVARGVVDETMRMALLGLALGIPAALAAAWRARALLFELSPSDPATLGLTTLLLALAALVAAWVPARRAARVDPVVALRHD